MRRSILALVGLLLGVVAMAPAGAAEPVPPPVVTVSVLIPPSMSLIRDCAGAETFSSGSGGFLLNRTSTTGPLSVAVQVDGPPATALSTVPTVAEFPAGEASAVVLMEFATRPTPGDLRVTALAGDGYDLGEPSSFVASVGEPTATWDCADDLGLDPSLTQQTIAVGEVPEPFGLYIDGSGGGGASEPPSSGLDLTRSGQARDLWSPMTEFFETPTVGDLPPGLTYVDDAWVGEASTPGTFTFEVHLCADPDVFAPDIQVCTGHSEVTIEVVPVGAGPEPQPESEPAAAVTAAASFAG